MNDNILQIVKNTCDYIFLEFSLMLAICFIYLLKYKPFKRSKNFYYSLIFFFTFLLIKFYQDIS